MQTYIIYLRLLRGIKREWIFAANWIVAFKVENEQTEETLRQNN